MAMERPPRDIAPAAFFEEWLPAAYAAMGAANRRMPGPMEVRVRLLGEGGGAWDLRIAQGALRVSGPSSSETPVTVTQSVLDWRAVACGEEGAFDLIPAKGGSPEQMFFDPAMAQLIGSVRGTVRFEVPGYNARTWQLTLKLGDHAHPGEPDAVISVDAETYLKLLKKQLQAPEAYFSGRIRITGNTGLAMQLAMAMLPRFG